MLSLNSNFVGLGSLVTVIMFKFSETDIVLLQFMSNKDNYIVYHLFY